MQISREDMKFLAESMVRQLNRLDADERRRNFPDIWKQEVINTVRILIATEVYKMWEPWLKGFDHFRIHIPPVDRCTFWVEFCEGRK